MDINNIHCRVCKLKSHVVNALDKEELNILDQGCFKNEFDRGEVIFKEGTPAQFVTYIRKGFVKQYKKGIGGKDYILSIAKQGAYLGIQNLNKQKTTNYFSAKAITKVQVCFLETKIFDKLLKQNGEFASEVISYICQDEMNYFERLVNNVQQQLNGRLADTLLYFKNEVYNENPFQLNLTKVELGSLIGTSRESVTRILKEFQDSLIIKEDKGTIEILDEAKLQRIKEKG